MTKYYVISSKTEKWDLHFTKSEGAKTPPQKQDVN